MANIVNKRSWSSKNLMDKNLEN